MPPKTCNGLDGEKMTRTEKGRSWSPVVGAPVRESDEILSIPWAVLSPCSARLRQYSFTELELRLEYWS